MSCSFLKRKISQKDACHRPRRLTGCGHKGVATRGGALILCSFASNGNHSVNSTLEHLPSHPIKKIQAQRIILLRDSDLLFLTEKILVFSPFDLKISVTLNVNRLVHYK